MTGQLQFVAVCVASAILIALFGCGSDDAARDSLVVTSTQRPIAVISATPTAGDWPLLVEFDGSTSSDPDGNITRYLWNFGDGSPSVSGVSTSHTYTVPGSFTATLTVTDDRGATASVSRVIAVTGAVTLSGRITYDRVPFAASGLGLDYSRTFAAPARGLVVQVLRSAEESPLASTVTDSAGRYELIVPPDTDVFVRVRAELLRDETRTGGPAWEIQIRDNTNGYSLYALDGSPRNTGTVNQTRDLHAGSGWPASGGTNYSRDRAAAPLAIADTLYGALQLIITSGRADQVFVPLDVFWSPENRPAVGDDDYSDGQIGGTQYFLPFVDAPSPPGIYLLGDDGVDTDEYDSHVIAHEFFHHLDNTLSRYDSIGGIHAIGDRLDLRVAYAEGFANAFSGMALNDPVLRNSLGPAQAEDFELNLEDNTWTNPGWFNEMSVASILWDIYDGVSDGPDATSVSFATIFDVQLDEVRTTPALTSLFVFIEALKRRAGVNVGAINAIVQAQSINASTLDAFGTTETNNGGISEALPIYTDIALNGPTRQVCGRADATSFFNKLGNRIFLRFSVPDARTVSVKVVGIEQGAADDPAPNPEFALYDQGLFLVSLCAGPDGDLCTQPIDTEMFEGEFEPGEYVLEVFDRSHVDTSLGIRPTTCMNVSITG